MTEADKTIPSFTCPHVWQNAGPPYYIYSSNNTSDNVPKDAPMYQNRVCIYCGGLESFQIKQAYKGVKND
jgi:hypothetical protein